MRDEFVLAAPNLLLVEVANALRSKLRAGPIAEAQARYALEDLPAYVNTLVRASDILADAFAIACQVNHPVADCVCLACAKAAGDTLLTDDAKLLTKAQGLEGVKVMPLSDGKRA